MFKKSALIITSIFAAFGCQSPTDKKMEKECCALPKAHSHVLRINIGQEPRTIDPARARDLQSITLVKMFYEGLTRIGAGDKIEPAIAEKIDISADLLTYTFHLRDATWSSGDPVTAHDFVYAWKRCLKPDTIAENAFQLYVIKNGKGCKEGTCTLDELKAEALDDRTLRIELENPTPYFLELASYPAFFPMNAKTLENETISNGPFNMKEWRHHDKISVEKNNKYWDAENVDVKGIDLLMVKEEAELAMFENQQIDWAGSPLSTIPVDAIPELRKKNILRSQPILGTYFLRLNTESKLLASPKLRRALSFGIDRQGIVEHVLLGSQVAAEGYVPTALNLRDGSYFENLEEDTVIRMFEEGLAESGLTRDDFAKIEMLYSSDERNQRIANALQERWIRLFGVQIKLFGVERKVYLEKLNHGDFQIAAGSWLADFGDAFSFLEVFKEKKSSTNHTCWGDQDYAKLLESSNQEPDPAQRQALLASCEKILLDAMPIIPIFHYNMLYVKNERVKNIYVSRMGGIDFRWARFDEDSGVIAQKDK